MWSGVVSVCALVCGLGLVQADPQGPDVYTVMFDTNIPVEGGKPGQLHNITLEVVRYWAPLGADRFYALVKSGFYNESAFFRVVPNFVVQFGIAGEPSVNAKWNTSTIKDDPVMYSNIPGTMSFATSGPNSRTTQVFFNIHNNSRLDGGFAPFGVVTGGYAALVQVYNPTPGSSAGVDQQEYMDKGNTWIEKQYPKIQFITGAAVTMEQWGGEKH